MPRNAEVIRQWSILRQIESARGAGVTIDELAGECAVTTRTIRRDLDALQEAGFPLFDSKADDGKTRWHFNGQALKGLSTGLTLSELCALYFSRTLVETLAGTPFKADVAAAFDKLAAGLTPHIRSFLDELPQMIAAKPDPARRYDGSQPVISRLVEAALHHRQANVQYHSDTSKRTKTYLLHPYRLEYAQGGLYLRAFVPEYREMRTFAVERIKSVSLLEERFAPTEKLPDEAFPDSLGVFSGPPHHVEVQFDAAVASYVRARTWHPSQRLRELPDGAVAVTLEVSLDRSLQSWILSFGSAARVVSPETLVREIAAQTRGAAAQYGQSRPSGPTAAARTPRKRTRV